jgi:hypothetical protein
LILDTCEENFLKIRVSNIFSLKKMELFGSPKNMNFTTLPVNNPSKKLCKLYQKNTRIKDTQKEKATHVFNQAKK